LGFRVQGPEVQRFRVQGFRGSRVQRFRVQRFKGSEVRGISTSYFYAGGLWKVC
jgi:hypothetical protein